jgi:hypothetical protein
MRVGEASQRDGTRANRLAASLELLTTRGFHWIGEESVNR